MSELEDKGKLLYEWMKVTRYSEYTTSKAEQRLRRFFTWCHDRGLETPQEISRPVVESYQRYLFHYRQKSGKPLSGNTQFGYLADVKRYFKFLAKHNHLLYNPASEIEMPRIERRLPRDVMSISEAEQVLIQPDINKPTGIRDRAMLELFYSTGIRRMELVNVSLYDVDFERGVLMIREGKGKRDRVVPVGTRALEWIEKYILEVRSQLQHGCSDDRTLFLSVNGQRFNPDHVTDIVRNYINTSGIEKKGSCHVFRHTMATLMLENGADVRFIQEMLGHANINTTQIYTRVSITQLKKIHNLTHPANGQQKPEDPPQKSEE
jgi:integrase/recombinase XerD